MIIFLFVLYLNLLLPLDALTVGANANSQLRIDARFLECSEKPNCKSKDTNLLSTIIKNEDSAESGNTPGYQGPYVLKDCFRKLYISAELNNQGQVSGDDEYILIDEVVDPVTDKLTPLMSPVVLKMHRKQPQLIYSLDLQQIVNGGAYEESYYTNNQNTESCDHSECGVSQYNGVSLPFSEGFCCSCSNPQKRHISPSYTNPVYLTEPELFSHLSKKRSTSFADEKKLSCRPKKPKPKCAKKGKKKCRKRPLNFFFENDKKIIARIRNRSRCKIKPKPFNNTIRKGHLKQGFDKQEKLRRVRQTTGTLRKRVDQERLKRVLDLKESRQHLKNKPRQSCDNGKPSGPSVHCLKLSDLWYSVFRFQPPIAVQEILLQVFQKKIDADGKDYWIDLTRTQTIRLGTLYPQAADDLPSISFSYSSELDPTGKVEKELSPIDIESNVLLVPTHEANSTSAESHPEAEGGPQEYLVVSKKDISVDGRGCDQIGTFFEGFSRQDRRCDRPQGSCLKHQPSDLWLEDMTKRVRGERGLYFAENFGKIANAVLASSVQVVKNDYLALNFERPFRSLIEVEIRADTNIFIRNGNVQIQSITTDSSGTHQSLIEVLIVNTGLTAGRFQPWLVDCSEDLPPDSISEGPMAFIPPLHRHSFRITLGGVLHASEMTCTVEVHNTFGERQPSRAVMVKKGDRCLCAFHCSCSCSQENFICYELMEEEYIAAGYETRLTRKKISFFKPGSLPAVYLIVFMILFLLLVLGKLKILLGWKIRRVKMYGIYFMIERLPLRWRDCEEKSLLQGCLYLFLNWFFFPAYFLMILCVCISRAVWLCCCCFITKPTENTTPSISRYSDTDNTYDMEADDEAFVKDTLGSLQLLATKNNTSKSAQSL